MLIPHRVRRGSASYRGLAHLGERTLRRCSVDVCRRRKRSRPGGKRAPVLYEPSPSPRWIGYIGRTWLQTSYYKTQSVYITFKTVITVGIWCSFIHLSVKYHEDNRPKSTPKRKARVGRKKTNNRRFASTINIMMNKVPINFWPSFCVG